MQLAPRKLGGALGNILMMFVNAVQHLLIPLNTPDKSRCCSKMPVALAVAASVVSHHSFKTALTALEWQLGMFILWRESGKQVVFQVYSRNNVLHPWEMDC